MGIIGTYRGVTFISTFVTVAHNLYHVFDIGRFLPRGYTIQAGLPKSDLLILSVSRS